MADLPRLNGVIKALENGGTAFTCSRRHLGYPRQYEHPAVVEAMDTILARCKEANVICGHPHVGTDNVEHLVEKGYRFLMCAPSQTYPALDMGRKLVGRA